MPTDWTSTAAALPSEGTLVEFLLDQRECPLRGVYSLGRFNSRWTLYSPTRVCRWREAGSVACEVMSPVRTSRPQAFRDTATAFASWVDAWRGSRRALRVAA